MTPRLRSSSAGGGTDPREALQKSEGGQAFLKVVVMGWGVLLGTEDAL